MSQESPVINTIFWVEGGSLNPEEFTQLTGISPSKSGREGELVANPNAAKFGWKIPHTFWRLEEERESYSMNDCVEAMLSLAWPLRETIVCYIRARPSTRIGITVVIHIHEDRPVYDLSLDSIKKLAYLGCEFAIDDIYRLP